jgi:perosamine synthetase
MISIYEPDIQQYSHCAMEAIKSGWISNHGKYVEQAITALRELLGVKHVILMSNGTCATHCLFIALKHKYPHIEKIYVPNNCYVAAWNACFMEYDHSVVEVLSMNEKTWNADLLAADKGSAVLVVHNLGNIVNVPALKRQRPDLVFIEDNCEGFSGKYEGAYSGTASLCSSISFYGNKIITTGEGGAFITNDDDVYDHVRKVYSQGMSSTRYVHNVHAYNYRMTNVQAAFLYEQLQSFDAIISKKRAVFETYKELLAPLIREGRVALMESEPDTENACWIFAVRIFGATIEKTVPFFGARGVDIRPFFYPIGAHAHLKTVRANEDAVSLRLNEEVIMIPSSPNIRREDQQKVVQTVCEFIHGESRELSLPVSIGEAMDKLTILDIKMSRIKDARRADVEREHQVLNNALSEMIERKGLQTLYAQMTRVNTVIWDLMDELRDGGATTDDAKYLLLCRKCVKLNDVRFRIKRKINDKCNSLLKEQKGYVVDRVVVKVESGVDSTLIACAELYRDEVVVSSDSFDVVLCAQDSREEALKKLRITIEEYELFFTLDEDKTIFAACMQPDCTKLVKYLLERGDGVEWTDLGNRTPLMVAAQHGCKETVELLLDAGSNMNHRSRQGDCVLLSAIHEGQTEVVKVLLKRGANLESRDLIDQTPLILAAQLGHKEIVEALLEAGANLHHRNQQGENALISAAQEGYIEIVKILLDAGADPNQPNADGQTPLQLAIDLKQSKELRELLYQRSRINI